MIYLGGLAATGASVSAHLKSRHETGAVLRKFGPALVELRAGIIVGNGSTSFEIIRCLTERLPVIIFSRWVVTKTQPIAVSDVLAYLEAALDLREAVAEPIGGSTIETYRSAPWNACSTSSTVGRSGKYLMRSSIHSFCCSA